MTADTLSWKGKGTDTASRRRPAHTHAKTTTTTYKPNKEQEHQHEHGGVRQQPFQHKPPDSTNAGHGACKYAALLRFLSAGQHGHARRPLGWCRRQRRLCRGGVSGRTHPHHQQNDGMAPDGPRDGVQAQDFHREGEQTANTETQKQEGTNIKADDKTTPTRIQTHTLAGRQMAWRWRAKCLGTSRRRCPRRRCT